MKNTTLNSQDTIIEEAERIIRVTIDSLKQLQIESSFVKAVTLLNHTKNNIFFLGVGKSGIIATKLSATFASLGFPAFFIHPTEALHGDMGRIQQNDIIIALSNSGKTQELLELLAVLKNRSLSIIAITGGADSPLAKMADILLLSTVNHEACRWNIVPTTSLVTAMVLGDALALCLAKEQALSQEHFAYNHPQGTLGALLQYTASDIMCTETLPLVHSNATLQEGLSVLNSCNQGAIFIIDETQKLLGILTDGDARRLLVHNSLVMKDTIMRYIKSTPIVGTITMKAGEILDIMEHNAITTLAIVDEHFILCGSIHIHDILGRGTVQFHTKNTQSIK